jgi:hypothetical protein
MVERPVFVPAPDSTELVKEISIAIKWNSGFAPVQKKKNIKALHDSAARAGYSPLLEVSTKSELELGRRLSSFHLQVHTSHLGDIPLECAFQGSKVFEYGGPYTDLYTSDVKLAKQDPRLQSSGRLLSFNFDGLCFPLEPKTAFYDWLYIGAIFPHREWLSRLGKFAGFTDIEFNPNRSINCQARSCALFVALSSSGLLDHAFQSPESFIALLSQHDYRPTQSPARVSGSLFRQGA